MRTKTLNPMIPILDAQLTAIEGRLSNTMESFERRVRRWFSKEHTTAYMDTFKIPWDELLLHYYESNIANKSYNEVYDMAVEQYLPELIEEQEDNDVEFNKQLEREQKAALKANAAKGKAKTTPTPSKANSEAIKKDKAQSSKKGSEDNKPLPKAMSLKFDDTPEDESPE